MRQEERRKEMERYVWMGKLPFVPKLVCDTQIKSVSATKLHRIKSAVLCVLCIVYLVQCAVFSVICVVLSA